MLRVVQTTCSFLNEAHVCCALRPPVLEKKIEELSLRIRLQGSLSGTDGRHGLTTKQHQGTQARDRRACVMLYKIGRGGLSHKTRVSRGGRGGGGWMSNTVDVQKSGAWLKVTLQR